MSTLMTFAEYAATLGVNASTVSRGVSKGTIPVVELADGRRLIDRSEADLARRRNSNIARGHGGRPDRATRKASTWKARGADGYDPAVKVCLSVMMAEWPALLCEGLSILGASEMDQARAVLVLNDLTSTLACVVHQDFNRERVHDYRSPLRDGPALQWSQDVQDFIARHGDDGMGNQWTSEEAGRPGGPEWADKAMSACWSAKP